jgi:hypothetical protein
MLANLAIKTFDLIKPRFCFLEVDMASSFDSFGYHRPI